jgi:hypothetical protein
MKIIVLKSATYFHVLTVGPATQKIIESPPIDFGSVVAGDLIKLLLKSCREAHVHV